MMSWRACRVGSRPLLGLLLLGAQSFGNDTCIEGAAGYRGMPQGVIGCQFESGECPDDPYHLGRYERFRTIFRRWSWKRNTSHADLLYRPFPPYWEPGYGYHETQWRRGEAAFNAYNCPVVGADITVTPAPQDVEQAPPPNEIPSEPALEATPPYSPPAEQPELPTPRTAEVNPLPRVRAQVNIKPIELPVPIPETAVDLATPVVPEGGLPELENLQSPPAGDTSELSAPAAPARGAETVMVRPRSSTMVGDETSDFDTAAGDAAPSQQQAEAFLPPALIGALVEDEFLPTLIMPILVCQSAGESEVESDSAPNELLSQQDEGPASLRVETAVATDFQPPASVRVQQISTQQPAAAVQETPGWKAKGARPTPASRRRPALGEPNVRPTAPGAPVSDGWTPTSSTVRVVSPDLVFTDE